ncbi:hypothetical protein ACFX2B_040027 [Malus domestica]
MKDATWSKWVDELKPIFKKKWMSNGIYELIMMSNTPIPIKDKLLLIVFPFWNTKTNTFDFKNGLMSHTILDMGQVFGLKLSTQGNPKEVVVGPKKEAGNELVLQEVTATTTMQEASSNHALEDTENIYEMFSESKSKVGPEANTKAPYRASPSAIKSSDFEPERRSKARHVVSTLGASPLRKTTKSQTFQRTTASLAETGRKKLKSARPTTNKKLDSPPKETMTSLEEKQSDTKVISKVLRDLKTSKERGSSQDKPFSSSSQPMRTSFHQAEPSEETSLLRSLTTSMFALKY